MIIFYFLSSLSVVLLTRFYLIRNSSSFFNQGFSGDASDHFQIIEACREGKKKITNYLIPGEMSYPILFHQFCRIFPNKVIIEKNFLPNFVLYISMATFMFFYSNYLGNKYMSNFPDWGAFYIVIFFSCSVQNLISINTSITYLTLSPRLMGKIGTSIFMLGLLFFLTYGDYLSLIVSLFGMILGFLSSIFASQLIIFSSIILSVILLSIHPFILLILGFTIAVIISKGYVIKIISSQIKWLIIYKQFICSSRYHKESLSKIFSIDEFSKYISNFDWRNVITLSIRSEPTRCFIVYPELIIISLWLIANDKPPNLFIDFVSYIVVSTFILYIITSTKYFNFLGEAYRYIEYGLSGIGPIILFQIFFDLGKSYNFFIIFIVYLILIFLLSYILQKKEGDSSSPNYDYLSDFLKKLNVNKKDVVFPVHMRLGSDIVARSKCKSLWWQPSAVTDKNIFKEYIHEYPYLSTNWKKLSKKHGVTLIIADKKRLAIFKDNYNFDDLKIELESDMYIAYRLKKIS